MTHKSELIALQNDARRAGRVCNFIVGESGIESVFYCGRLVSPLCFAESERQKQK